MSPDPVLEVILTRRSTPRLAEPAPGHSELLELIQAAATAPDHGRIRPWRLIVLEGHDRVRLGEAFREAAPDHDQAQRAVGRPMRAPMLLSIVFCPKLDHPTVPEWEQLAAVVALVQNLLLLLHSRGWGAIWRTGTPVEAPQVRKHLGVTDDEKLLGWLYIGTPTEEPPGGARETFDVRPRISWPSRTADGFADNHMRRGG
jgi:nitroreductase